MCIKILVIYFLMLIRIRAFEKILTAVWPQTIQHDLMKVYNQIQERRVDVIVNQKELFMCKAMEPDNKRLWIPQSGIQPDNSTGFF